MKKIKSSPLLLVWLVLTAFPFFATAQVGNLPERLTPIFDETTIAYAHLDLRKISVTKALTKLQKMGGLVELIPLPPAGATKKIEAFRQSLVDAGVTHIFATASLFDLQSIPVVAVMVDGDGKLSEVEELLKQFKPLGFDCKAFQKQKMLVLARHPNVIKRLDQQLLRSRTDINEILSSRMRGIGSFHFIPSADHLRVIRELTPKLDPPFDFINGDLIADGIRSASLTLQSVEPLELKAGIRSKDSKSAQQIKEAITEFQQNIRPSDPERIVLKGILSQLALNKDENGLTLEIGKKEEKLLEALQPFFKSAQEQVKQGQQVNDLKFILLSFHNFHDVYRYFPDLGLPQDKGKPGLSWRVHVLPFLGEQKLYKEFKLDEPWDSDHNKKLVSKIPKVFKPKDGNVELGRTLFVVPRGKGFFANPYKPSDDAEKNRTYGRMMREFLDGTSNTIAVLPVAKKHAVIWTKPEDFSPDSQTLMSYLKDDDTSVLTFATTDGAVHRVKFESLTVKKLMAMLTIAGGEVVDWNR